MPRRRRGPLRQLGALLAAFAVGLLLVVVLAVVAPDVLRIGDERGSDGASAAALTRASEELAEAAVRETPSGADAVDGESGTGADADADEDAEGSGAPGDAADAGSEGSAAADPDTGESDVAPSERVLQLVNAERAAAGCPALRGDPALDDLAAAHSSDMAVRGYLDHTTPEGLTPWDRAEAAGVAGVAAENIARGQPDAAAVVAAWMDSPGHRDNLLSCDLTRQGLGMAQGAGGPWWTQVFGR